MKCDICNKDESAIERAGKDLFFGRWISYCSDCQEAGEAKDHQLTYDNELAPDVESGDFTYTDNQGLSDILEDLI